MDSEQITEEMRRRRVAIDQKLDALGALTAAAKRRVVQRVIPVATALAVALAGIWWWRRRAVA